MSLSSHLLFVGMREVRRHFCTATHSPASLRTVTVTLKVAENNYIDRWLSHQRHRSIIIYVALSSDRARTPSNYRHVSRGYNSIPILDWIPGTWQVCLFQLTLYIVLLLAGQRTSLTSRLLSLVLSTIHALLEHKDLTIGGVKRK